MVESDNSTGRFKVKIISMFAVVIALAIGVRVIGGGAARAEDDGKANMALLDNCNPRDPAWVPLGGCISTPHGDVTVAEFNAFLFNPLSPPLTLIGHPSWRIQPSFTSVRESQFRVFNGGGRAHTFTEVANYGGGFIAPLNGDLATAPECLDSPHTLAAGTGAQLHLSPGLHKFQCCIHPWMRAAVKVQ